MPFFLCGLFMIAALIISLTRLKDPEEMPAPLRLGEVFQPFRRPAFVALCVITATYNFVFFIVLGFTPIFLGLDVVPLGLVFTAWGVGLAFGILVVGHRLAHRFGAVQTVGFALIVLMLTLIGLATSHSTAQSVVVLIVAGVCMGICNANLTDLALATGSPDRRVTTGAFNLVRWGFAAPAPVVAGLLAEHVGLTRPVLGGRRRARRRHRHVPRVRPHGGAHRRRAGALVAVEPRGRGARGRARGGARRGRLSRRQM